MARRGINKVIILGNLGQDPETRYMPNGGAVTNVSIATSETWKDKSSGQDQERTEWHRVVFFNRLAEIAGEYLRKGSKVYIEGSLRTRKWQDQNGNDRYTTEIVASDMQMLDTKGGGGGSDQGGGNYDGYDQMPEAHVDDYSARPAAPAPRASAAPSRPAPAPAADSGIVEDDIPF